VLVRGSEQSEQPLGDLHGQDEVVTAVNHQKRSVYARSEIHLVRFGRRLDLGFEAATEKSEHLDTWLDCGQDRSHCCSPAQAIIGNCIAAQVLSGLDVV